MPPERASGVKKGRLRVHDPFELIRWLALSQPDPRKALAELIQNSLDAEAGSIRAVRYREKRLPCLKILDDGEGVIPELDRPDALAYVATHIGHSRKQSLTPEERLSLMTQGQYGIGLLGFWSLGEMLEMRSWVPGQKPHRLVLYRDRPDYRIEPIRGRLSLDERRTEVVVAGIHREALPALGARRAADYLASELRGQLLAREVELVIEDRIARGRAQKLLAVRPRRFLGERLQSIGPIEVPGYPPIQIEVYLTGETDDREEPRGVSLYAAGTLVAEDFEELAALGLDHRPWTDPRLTGLVDFPGLRVAPGSRRGIVPDAAAGALVTALEEAGRALKELLAIYERRRLQEIDRSLLKDLQRAFRDFYRQRPRYTMLPIEGRTAEGVGPASPGVPASGAEGPIIEGAVPAIQEEEPSPPVADLFPPGPLAEVRITPSPLRVECGGRRRAHARALDASRRPVAEPVDYEWKLTGAIGRLEMNGTNQAEVLIVAGPDATLGKLSVTARSNGREAVAETTVEILEELPATRTDEGIPEPELVDQPAARWRSRIIDGHWQVNAGHSEYREIAEQPALKLRYLALLFAKEVVLRSGQDPRLEIPLEQMVEVAAYADRKLAQRRPRKR
ncbi:MAG: ATP-binding protein [Gemmatimonadota bacterium]